MPSPSSAFLLLPLPHPQPRRIQTLTSSSWASFLSMAFVPVHSPPGSAPFKTVRDFSDLPPRVRAALSIHSTSKTSTPSPDLNHCHFSESLFPCISPPPHRLNSNCVLVMPESHCQLWTLFNIMWCPPASPNRQKPSRGLPHNSSSLK